MTPHLTASPSCKELSIPERAVDKKTPHKGDRQQKECLTTLGWTISFTTSFTKTAADGIQTGTRNMETLIAFGFILYLAFCVGGGILSDGRKKRRW